MIGYTIADDCPLPRGSTIGAFTLTLVMAEQYGRGWHALYEVSRAGVLAGLVERDHHFGGSYIDEAPRFQPACRVDRGPGEPACWNTGTGWSPTLTEAVLLLADHLLDAHLGFHKPRPVAGVEVPTCRDCGCTDDEACPGGCAWVEDDLCSSCAVAEVAGPDEHAPDADLAATSW